MCAGLPARPADVHAATQPLACHVNERLLNEHEHTTLCVLCFCAARQASGRLIGYPLLVI
jgi:hypothetical protein